MGIEDYRETPRGHRVLHLVGKGSKPIDRHGVHFLTAYVAGS